LLLGKTPRAYSSILAITSREGIASAFNMTTSPGFNSIDAISNFEISIFPAPKEKAEDCSPAIVCNCDIQRIILRICSRDTSNIEVTGPVISGGSNLIEGVGIRPAKVVSMDLIPVGGGPG